MIDYHWCYEGDCAPSTWGQCTEACNGMHQSPIDIPEAVQMGSASGTKTLMFSNYENVGIYYDSHIMFIPNAPLGQS